MASISRSNNRPQYDILAKEKRYRGEVTLGDDDEESVAEEKTVEVEESEEADESEDDKRQEVSEGRQDESAGDKETSSSLLLLKGLRFIRSYSLRFASSSP